MKTPQEFRALYSTKSQELLGIDPGEQIVKDAFDSYVALVKFTGTDGDLEFDISSDSDQLKVIFNPKTP